MRFTGQQYHKIKGVSNTDKYLNSAAYCDSCIGVLVDSLKSSELWDRTLLVITADHTSREPGGVAANSLENYQIPMIWTGGVIKAHKEVDHISMQTDFGLTLIQQLGGKPSLSPFSKNMLGSGQYAFYYQDNGWGFVSPEVGFYEDMELAERTYFYGQNHPAADSLDNFSKAFTQYLHDDFMNRK